MKKKVLCLVLCFLCIMSFGMSNSVLGATEVFRSLIPEGGREYNYWSGISKQAAQEAWSLMGEKPDDIIVLTNGGHAVVGGYTTEACLDGVAEATGCTFGRGNLLNVNSSREQPLWFFFYDKGSGNGVYCEVNGQEAASILGDLENQIHKLSKDNIFSQINMENIKAENLLENPEAWNEKVNESVFGGNEFRIVTITNAVVEGAPHDFMNAVLFHDHYCPGVTSGYLIANYLEREFPLNPGESYYVISTPHWCKDDALQVVLNTTPGKSGMAVLPLSDEMRARLKPEAENLAGIYFRYNSSTNEGKGIVLGFDMDKAEVEREGFGWEWRLKMNMWYADYLDSDEMFVEVIDTFQLKEGEVPADYARPGTNPLEKLDLLEI